MCTFCQAQARMAEVAAGHHAPRSEWFWAELALIGARWDVPGHPFYVRWAAGELSPRELADHAAQYGFLLTALAAVGADAVDKAMGLVADALRPVAAAKHLQVDRWRTLTRASFARIGSVPDGVLPGSAAAAAARRWAGSPSRSLALDLVTLHVVEVQGPRMARALTPALRRTYDGGAETAGCFHPDSACDADAGALTAAAISGLLPTEDPFGLLRQAEAVLCAHWSVLDELETKATTWQ